MLRLMWISSVISCDFLITALVGETLEDPLTAQRGRLKKVVRVVKGERRKKNNAGERESDRRDRNLHLRHTGTVATKWSKTLEQQLHRNIVIDYLLYFPGCITASNVFLFISNILDLSRVGVVHTVDSDALNKYILLVFFFDVVRIEQQKENLLIYK